MKKAIAGFAFVVVILAVHLHFFPAGQRPDRSFDTSIARPSYPRQHPLVLFDEGHYNAHQLDGTFEPFRKLLESDGYAVRPCRSRFSAKVLQGASALVIVNASGGSNPKLFSFNLVPLRKGKRDDPAFLPAEIDAIRRWVAGGGSLLLVADHYPFGSASAGLAAAFGITMHGGYAGVPAQVQGRREDGAIEFSRANGLLPVVAITNGRSEAERVDRVLSFTGQSLDANNGVALLKLPEGAVEYVPPPPNSKQQSAGAAQAVALEYGRGRVVVPGEAAMLTAQIAEGQRFGMNVPNTHNRQFTLNVMHWLSRLL